MGVPQSGHLARIQIGSNVITNANAYDLTRAVPTVEVAQFGETHTRNVAAQRADSGTITAWQPKDSKVLDDTSGTEDALWIYPFYTTTPTAYWYGVVLFGDSGSTAATGAGVGATLPFVNANVDGTGMTAFGFA